MHQVIKIGTLHPASGIYPGMGRNFENGIKLAILLNKEINENFEFIFLKEYVKQGDHKTVAEEILKLSDYENVDLICGIINARVLQLIIDNTGNKKIPLLANNLGEFIPKKEIENEYITGNSLNMWQSQWAMGQWAQKQYGGDPLMCVSVYDGGYLLHNCFQLGALAAGASTVKTGLLHLQPGIVDTSPLIEQIKKEKPSHVHAVLCGIDAKDFMKRFENSGLKAKVPLTVSPFMVEDNLMDEIKNMIEGIPNAITWTLRLPNKENETFKAAYLKEFHNLPDVFSLLGYESGLAVCNALQSLNGEKISRQNIAGSLKEVSITGPRGNFKLGFQNQNFDALIRKPVLVNNHYENSIFSTEKTVDTTNPHIISSAKNNVSGWLNPYLCM